MIGKPLNILIKAILLSGIFLLRGVGPVQAEESAPALWFPVGEVLNYKVYWGVIAVGTTQMTTEWTEENGRRLLAIRMRTRSNRFLSSLYPEDDFFESLIDPATFLPVRFTQKQKEGRYRCDEVTNFDHPAHKARWQSFVKNREKEYAIESDTRDLLSFLYYVRGQAQCFTPGEEKDYRIMTDEKLYDVLLKPVKAEKISLANFGKVTSIRFEPEAKFQGLFVHKGKMWLWVSDDTRRILVRIIASIPVANVKIVLNSVTGPGEDGWVKHKSSAGPGDQENGETESDEADVKPAAGA